MCFIYFSCSLFRLKYIHDYLQVNQAFIMIKVWMLKLTLISLHMGYFLETIYQINVF